MRYLIIHPEDSSTTFLKSIYNILEDFTIISKDSTQQKIIESIHSHDRVIMCGHGTPEGLLSVGQFDTIHGYVIDVNMVDALSKKDNSIFIWCNADQFVKKYKLKGFYTWMFISEVGESIYCGLQDVDQDQIDLSNTIFSYVLAQNLHLPQSEMFEEVKLEYGNLAKKNAVAKYNNDRLYLDQ